MKPLHVIALTTRIFRPGENLLDFIAQSVPAELIKDKMILAVTSKIVSLAERRLVPASSIDKENLVLREADQFFGEIGHGCFLTIKSGLLIPSAGIDESNSENGDYILYPEDAFASAQTLWSELRARWKISSLGIVITDSYTIPLRRGVSGICLAYAGFRAVRNLIGTSDLFGRELRLTQINFADGLAATAVMMMGEGAEARPLVMIKGAEIEFSETTSKEEIQIPLQEDLYYPLLKALQRRT